ncbi:MAG: helix-turn-helix domain-containing protein [Leadbetterella sp.]|nr:helix-turn-helix domain-containing protein [Leadbetterella sp.]
MTHTTKHLKIHEGRNVKRFREMLGIKQDALAFELGEDWNQQKISLLEQKETIDNTLLQQISEALKIPVEAIKNFDEEQAVNIISNTFNTHDQSSGVSIHPITNINPIEKWLEALEEIKKLNAEKIELYERMLKEKDEMLARLEKLIGK